MNKLNYIFHLYNIEASVNLGNVNMAADSIMEVVSLLSPHARVVNYRKCNDGTLCTDMLRCAWHKVTRLSLKSWP